MDNATEYNVTTPGLDYTYGSELDKAAYKGDTYHKSNKALALEFANKPEPLTRAEIKLLREEMGYTRTQLGAILGKARHTVINWESGRTLPDKCNNLLIQIVYLLSINHDKTVMELLRGLNNEEAAQG